MLKGGKGGNVLVEFVLRYLETFLPCNVEQDVLVRDTFQRHFPKIKLLAQINVGAIAENIAIRLIERVLHPLKFCQTDTVAENRGNFRAGGCLVGGLDTP